MLYQQEGSIDLARRHQEEALKLQPANLTFMKNLADLLYLACNENEEAMRLYVKILTTSPRDVETLTAISRISIEIQ